MDDPRRVGGIGVALSSGGAAGLAHVGVLEVLRQAGLDFTCAAGTSAGAVVGAALASDGLEGLRDRFVNLGVRDRVALFDLTWLAGGLFAGRRAMEMVRPFVSARIEEMPRRFAAIATDLESGDEVMLHSGPTIEALRASIAVPGMLVPSLQDGRLLVDGALANPIPVSVARALGARFVIAVSVIPRPQFGLVRTAGTATPVEPGWLERSRRAIDAWRNVIADDAELPEVAAEVVESVAAHNVAMVLSRSSALIQARIAATRLREDPADFLIEPDVADIGLCDFNRAADAVEAGRRAARAALPQLRQCLRSRPVPRPAAVPRSQQAA